MEFRRIESPTEAEIAQLYAVYRHCMYNPTPAKFRKRLERYLADGRAKLYACIVHEKVVGVMTIMLCKAHTAELLGIAVEEEMRGSGIGTAMLAHVASENCLTEIIAQTDEEAVGFYRKCGFAVTSFTESFKGETVIRYRCTKWT